MEYRCGKIGVFFSVGDITEIKTDVVVNAANNQLWMGAGVAGAIKRKGGQTIEDEAVGKGPVPVGEAVVTTGGALKAKYVIHAAGMGQDLSTDADKIHACTLNSLKRAEELEIKTIAFPAIGTGVGGFPLETAADSMIRAVVAHADRGATEPETVHFVLFQQEIFDIFKGAADRLLVKGEG